MPELYAAIPPSEGLRKITSIAMSFAVGWARKPDEDKSVVCDVFRAHLYGPSIRFLYVKIVDALNWHEHRRAICSCLGSSRARRQNAFSWSSTDLRWFAEGMKNPYNCSIHTLGRGQDGD